MTAHRDNNQGRDWRGLDVFPPAEQMPTISDPSDEYELYGDFGQFAISDDQLPAASVAITPDERAQWQQQFQLEREAQERERRMLWDQTQKTRTQMLRLIDDLRRNRDISNAAYDLLQSEFSLGLIPAIYRDVKGDLLVWSAAERCYYTLPRWERKAQQALRVDDPDRETMRLTPPPPSHPWSPALNSAWPATPARPMRPTPRFWQSLPWRRATGQPVEAPAGYRADYGDGFGAPAPATVPMLSDNERRGLV